MRLIINVYLVPMALILGACLAAWAGESLAGLGQHFELLAISAYYTTCAFAVGAFVFTVMNNWKVWRAYRGRGEICYRCGGPVGRREGHHGPYFHCWACGTNRAARL